MKWFLKLTVGLLFITVFICMCTGAYFWYIWSGNLPVVDSAKEYRPPIITEIFSDDGEVIGRFWDEKRIVVPLDRLPQHLIHAFVAAEDARFFEHEGLDIISIFRAFLKNLAAGKIEQGGSTITQQMTRSLLLKNAKRTYRRKVREAILSIQFEKTFSKKQILFIYLNQIYLGQGAYGVETAARTYFNKSAKDLSIAESALIAGLPQAPAKYSPIQHFERAKARQRYVLERMLAERYITENQFGTALKTPLHIRKVQENTFAKAPYFTEHIRRYLYNKYGRELFLRDGLKVYTSLNLGMQRAAIKSLQTGLSELDKREGYRGVIRHLSPQEIQDFNARALAKISSSPLQINSIVEGVVEEVSDKKGEVIVRIGDDLALLKFSRIKWARKPDPDIAFYAAKAKNPSEVLCRGDVVLVRLLKAIDPSSPAAPIKTESRPFFAWEISLEQIPEIQGAILCMVPETGEVKAMVGGLDFAVSQFNRATQSRRQPGSVFKPVIYAAALDRGMKPCEVLLDAPYVSEQNPEEVWKPKNYKGRFFGPTLFRTALAESRNVITVKILKKIGVNYAIRYATNMGIESKLSPDLSLALGSSGVSLVEIVKAYSVFANGGILARPIFIKMILDRSGQIIEENQSDTKEVISRQTAYVMTNLLEAVIQEGTGWRIKALKRPAAGKTGTTNNLWDAWFVGYTPGLVTGVWVGYDDRKAMGKGETGSRAAAPIWLYFMSDVLKGRQVANFKVPEGIVFAKIDAKTGLLAGPYSEKTIFQAFKEGTEPKEYSPEPTSPKSGQFLQFDMDHLN